MEMMVDVCLGPRRPGGTDGRCMFRARLGGSDGWCMFKAQETRWK